MIWGENRGKWKNSSRRESNPGHLWLEPPVLCHWAMTVGQSPALKILHMYCFVFFPLSSIFALQHLNSFISSVRQDTLSYVLDNCQITSNTCKVNNITSILVTNIIKLCIKTAVFWWHFLSFHTCIRYAMECFYNRGQWSSGYLYFGSPEIV